MATPYVHPRNRIRDAAVATLRAYFEPEIRVYSTRVSPYMQKDYAGELPGIAVYTLHDVGRVQNVAPRRYERHVELAVEVVISGKARKELIDTNLDDLCRVIEVLLLNEDTLGGTCNDLLYASTVMDFGDQGDPNVGAARIIFDAEYLDYFPTAEQAADLPDLKRVWVDYSLEGKQDDARDQAHQHIEGLSP
ncbi:hypothetical protein [Pseudomonas fluorescens]|uniref:Uncharacterized protein n=1 Tax=Pseudomonas fluorescens TaxID=294 RepID=A0A5E7Q5H0_PSEFL|nr:hypothetical protein [Pseudomonas fluorescens]VVP57141.1 hypothetical protein PS880_05785 [Pseudomonas fluorescens]